MGITIAAIWSLDLTPDMADPGVGAFRLDATTFAGVTRAAVATVDGLGTDRTAMLTALTTDDTVQTAVLNDDVTARATYTVTAPAIDHGTWVEVPLTCVSGDAAVESLYFAETQRIVVSQDLPTGAYAVGDLVYNGQPYQLVPANDTAVVVAIGEAGTLLLFRDGTQGWFSAADQATYAVAWIGTAPAKYAAYVYETDLQVHEDWRGGYFDPVWLPHPPAGSFAVFARARGAPPDTGIYEG